MSYENKSTLLPRRQTWGRDVEESTLGGEVKQASTRHSNAGTSFICCHQRAASQEGKSLPALFSSQWDVFICLKNILFVYLVAPGLSCGMQTLSCSIWELVPWPGIKPRPLALGAWRLSYWTIREVSVFICFSLNYIIHFLNCLQSFLEKRWGRFKWIGFYFLSFH